MEQLKEFSWKKLTIIAAVILIVFLLQPSLGAKALDVVMVGLIAIAVVDIVKLACKTLVKLNEAKDKK